MSRKVWYCPFCGYEVNARGRCHSCGERLIASPLAELESGPDDDEVGYRLDQWDDATRGRLIQLLISGRVSHRFEDEELVVLANDESRVDRLVSRANGEDEEDELDETGEGKKALAAGDRQTSLELYEAADHLRKDPTDMQADVDLAQASAAVFAVDYLPDLDEAHMAAIGRVTRRLLGALGADEALEGEIGHQAEILCRLVAPSAGEAEAAAETERARARLETGAKEKGREVGLPQSDVTPGGEMDANVPVAARPEEPEEGAGGTGDVEAELPPAEAVDGAEPAEGADGAERAEAGRSAAGTAGATGDEELEPLAREADEPEPVEPDEPEPDEPEELEDLDEETGEIVYELAEWLPEQRIELSMLLESAGVAYNWEGADLTVAEEHETEVEALFGQVRGLAEEDDEARYRSIEELFGSVDRLANDPSNEERQQAFLQAVVAVEQPTPVGVDDAYWWRVRSQGHAVVAAIEGDSRLDEVSREAALLAEMLHEMV